VKSQWYEPLDEHETPLYQTLLDIFGDTLDEITAHILFYLVHNYRIGIRTGDGPQDWFAISLTQRGTAAFISHFHVIDHPEGWHNYVYWYHFINSRNPYELPLAYESREAVMLTEIANHPRVVLITDDDDLASHDSETFLH
jgi:hypothetical protein